MSGVTVITFGCRLNTYESEVMRAEAEKAGLNNAVLVNTCAVTGEAVRHTAARIRQVQEMLGRRIAIENASYYVAPPGAEGALPGIGSGVRAASRLARYAASAGAGWWLGA